VLLLMEALRSVVQKTRGGACSLDQADVDALVGSLRVAEATIESLGAPGASESASTAEERKQRVEQIAHFIRDHSSLVAKLQREGEAAQARGLVPVVRADLGSDTANFLLSHLVLSRLQAADVLAMACTSKAWLKRCKTFRALQSRTDSLLLLCRSERQYLGELSLLIDEFGKTVEVKMICRSIRLVAKNKNKNKQKTRPIF
jgi:hypothetical protein